MTTIIGVRFKSNGKMYYFDPQGVQVTAGTDVIVDTARGLEYGSCVQGNTEVPEQSVVQPLRRMVRIATDADRKRSSATRGVRTRRLSCASARSRSAVWK